MQLQLLGTGDAFGSGGRFQTCFRLSGAGDDLLIDCGATALPALKAAGIDPSSVGWVVISHLHGDHFGGLPFLVLDGQFSRRTAPLAIAGPPGIERRFTDALEAFFPGAAAASRRFETRFVELEERGVVGPATVTPFEVRHPSGAPAYALRIEYGGRVIAYSGDTEWTDALLSVAAGADVLVCEAYHYDKRVPYHLDYRTVLNRREELGCRRIVLTHMSQDVLDREVELERGHDGMVIEL